MTWFCLVISACLLACVSVQKPGLNIQVSLLAPKGIEFKVEAVAGVILVAIHYNIGTPLPGVHAGRWNYDVTSKTGSLIGNQPSPAISSSTKSFFSGNYFVHQNRGVSVNRGQIVYYWVYMIRYGRGHQYTNQRWTAGGRPGGGVVVTSAPVPQPGNNGAMRTVFIDNFNNINLNEWEYELSGWGGGNGEFQVYTSDKRNSYAKDGVLYIKPTLTSEAFGETFYWNNEFDVTQKYGGCTQKTNYGCKKPAKYLPIMSGKLTTKKAWKYGRVTVRAKMPRGDWIWPAIWLLPKDWHYGVWPKSGEIDIVESRGNRNLGKKGIQHVGATLHWGLYGDNQYRRTTGSVHANSETYGAEFHTYVLDWDAEGISVKVDGKSMLNHRTGQGYCKLAGYGNCGVWNNRAAPFDQRFYIILNVAVGATGGFFSDGGGKPWSNRDGWNGAVKFYQARNKWLPTWKGEDAAMWIDYVKVEQ